LSERLSGQPVEWYRQRKAIERGEQQGYDGWGIAKSAAIGGVIGAVEGAFATAISAMLEGKLQ